MSQKKYTLIHKVLQFLSTNKEKKNLKKMTGKWQSENWEYWDKSNKVRESLKW